MRRIFRTTVLFFTAALFANSASHATAQIANHGIAAAMIDVVQNDTGNTTNSVTVTASLAMNGLAIRPGSNRGDFNVQHGGSFSDDVNTGVLITSVAQNGRDNEGSGFNYCTTAMNYSRTGANTGAYYIPVFNAPAGAEYNINVAAAFFPYTNWIGGLARNSSDSANGPNNLFTGTPGLTLGTHFVDQGNGVSKVNLSGLGIDSRTDGVLLVTHGNNSDKYALSQVNANDGTWTVYVKDNGANSNTYEQGAVAFAYVPRTNQTVISGRFRGDGAILMHSGPTPSFTITSNNVGTWRLVIPGHSPATGVLIISPEGGESYNQDNIVSYEPNGDSWLIQSRDLPGNPPALQTPELQPVASFVFIPVLSKATLLAPANGALNQVKSPTLQVSISNAVPGNSTVQFYGRKAERTLDDDFTIIALPDTQYYVSTRNGGRPEMFYAQTEWIITNRVERNIVYVTHLGDITQDGDLLSSGSSNLTQWRNATNAMYRLENPARTSLEFGIPYGVAVGNHDQEPIGSATGGSAFYNQFFGISHFQGRPYYAGHYGTNNDNHFDFFSASGLDFIVLYFEFDTEANADVLAWGNAVLQTNQHRRAIVVTHNLGNTATPVNFSAQGSAIYNALKGNTNLFMMLAGHVTGEGSRVDTFNGNTVRTFVSDYQGWTNGGNGFLRIIQFSPQRNEVVFQTYSPWVDEYRTGPTSEIFFPYSMRPAAARDSTPFALIGTVSGVAPGGITSVLWPNLLVDTEYEWHVVVTDAAGNVVQSSPSWRFTTAAESAPVVTHRLVNVMGDAPTNLLLTAFDPNGDVIYFQTNSWPSRGLNRGFNPQTGAVTYQPAHGFRGFDQFTYQAYDASGTSGVVTLVMNVVSPADADNDGLPDAWEARHGVADPNADDDGDGRKNRDEYLANTDPKNAASVLRIGQASRAANGHVSLNWPAIGGTRYRVQYSNGGANGSFTGQFTDIVQPLTLEINPAPYGTESTNSFVDDFSLTGGGSPSSSRYYRIKVVQ